MVFYSSIDEHDDGGFVEESRGGRERRGRFNTIQKDGGYVGQASWLSSNINLVNTIVGAGVLSMSKSLSQMGILLGTFVILWSAVTAGFGLYLQARCTRYLERGSASFFALSQITYPNAAVVFDAAIAIKCFGVGVSYLIIIGDLMPGVVRGFSDTIGVGVPFLLDRHFWVTAFMLVVIPLSFLRRLDSLKYTSVVALVSIGYLVVLVVYHFAKGDTMAARGDIRVVHWAGAISTLSSIPVIVFAYTCHQNMFSILNEIKDNSPRRHVTCPSDYVLLIIPRTFGVIAFSIGSAAFIYVLVAITGYLSFGNHVTGNIVGMYIPSVASTIGKAAIVVLVMFSYPLQVHPCRASVHAMLNWRPTKKHARATPNGSPARTRPLLQPTSFATSRSDSIGELRFAAITTGIIILSYIVAMTVSSLDKVLAYVGSTGSTSISFILPGLFFYKISAPDSPHHQRLAKEDDDEIDNSDVMDDTVSNTSRQHAWQEALLRKLALALAVYGFVVMIVCLATNTFLNVSH